MNDVPCGRAKFCCLNAFVITEGIVEPRRMEINTESDNAPSEKLIYGYAAHRKIKSRKPQGLGPIDLRTCRPSIFLWY
jgi:hypothetical protein